MEDFVDEFGIFETDEAQFKKILELLRSEGIKYYEGLLKLPLSEFVLRNAKGELAEGSPRPPEDQFIITKYCYDFLISVSSVDEFNDNDIDYLASQIVMGKLKGGYVDRQPFGIKIFEEAYNLIKLKYGNSGLSNKAFKESYEKSILYEKYGLFFEKMRTNDLPPL